MAQLPSKRRAMAEVQTDAFKPDGHPPPPAVSEAGRGHHRWGGQATSPSFLPELELGVRKEKGALRTDRPWRNLERNLGRRGGAFRSLSKQERFCGSGRLSTRMIVLSALCPHPTHSHLSQGSAPGTRPPEAHAVSFPLRFFCCSRDAR